MHTTQTATTRVVQEIIPIEQGRLGLMANSRLLHNSLHVNRQYANWINEKIARYGFREGEDFLTVLLKSTGGRPATDYIVTLDMAKELAMLEENQYGHAIRRYFIEIEKQYRDWIGFVLPRLEKDVDLFSEKIGYNYCQLLGAVGLSTSRAAQKRRQRQYPHEFWRGTSGIVFVSESYGKTIIAHAAARKLSKETRYRNILTG